jgi:hypothetical protein
VDFDGDGIDDLVSGSYDPGEFYLFRGKGKGQFAARETIVDKTGKPVLLYPHQKAKWESFGSWLALVDWNNDGALDLVLGGYRGEVMVRLNEGTRTKPVYATENIRVQLDGKDLEVPGGHATPVIADWDGDGRWDLLTGSATGAVYWYRNIGKPGAPQFAAPVKLVPEHAGNGYNELLDDGEEPVPGIRSQIAVADVNGDGKLDLLVGDFCTNTSLRKDLSAEQRRQLQEVRRKLRALEPELTRERERLDAAFQKCVKVYSKDEIVKDEVQAKLRAKQKELYEDTAYKKVADEHAALTKALNEFLEKPKQQRFGAEDMATPHGYVWLYLRK